MHGFYESKYPEIAKNKQLEIRNAIDEVQQIFRRTTFPEMKLNWQTHPNNLGHFYFNGCFRCHDGQHVSPEGKVVSKDCNICHTVMGQEEGGVSMAANETKLSTSGGVGRFNPGELQRLPHGWGGTVNNQDPRNCSSAALFLMVRVAPFTCRNCFFLNSENRRLTVSRVVPIISAISS